MIVVDASVVVELLLGRTAALDAVTSELTGALDEALHAPELIEPEALSSLRRLERQGAISASAAERVVSELDQLRLIRYPHGPFRDRVWALRHNLTPYDALYLALAEALPDAILMTADAGLATNAVDALGAQRVRHLS